MILRMLEKMSEEKDGKPLGGPYNRLRENWSLMLKAAGEAVDLPADDKPKIVRLVTDLYQMLYDGARSVRYHSWNEAKNVGERLLNPNGASGTCNTADILNGGWYGRLQPGSSPTILNDRAIELWQAQNQDSPYA